MKSQNSEKRISKSTLSLGVSLSAVFAVLYTVGVVVLAPISFQIFQVRVADALLPLSIVFGWPATVGLAVGAFVANFYGGLGIVDIVGGSVANFLACATAWQIGRRRFRGSWLVATTSEVIIVTLIVGTYLSYLFGMPLEVGLSGVLLGSIVSMGFLGYGLLLFLSRTKAIQSLRARGLAIYLR